MAAVERPAAAHQPDQAAAELTARDIADAKSRFPGVTWDCKQAKWAATVQHGSEVNVDAPWLVSVPRCVMHLATFVTAPSID